MKNILRYIVQSPRIKCVVIILAVAVICFTIFHHITTQNSYIKDINEINSGLFKYALQKSADADNAVILSFVDYGYLDFGINLYLSSYKKLGLNNYLFIGSDSMVCPAFRKVIPEINCVQNAVDIASTEASGFGTASFERKSHRKIEIVIHALKLGFTILMVDIDIVMFKNPLPYLKQCLECDIQIQSDQTVICTGFYYVRPTSVAIAVFEETLATVNTRVRHMTVSENKNDQVVMDKILKAREKSGSHLVHKVLPTDDFPSGNAYFESRKIMFATDAVFPPNVYTVHDNFIISEAAKKYRFRENLMWVYDKNGYFSDDTRKYIVYNNTLQANDLPKGIDIHQLESDALKAALSIGYLLNRTVILPSFSCVNCSSAACQNARQRCSLNAHFMVESLDKHFGNSYREHVFLKNELVPNKVKESVSAPFLIESDFSKDHLLGKTNSVLQRLIPSNGNRADINDILKWFTKYNDISVLVFHSLYDCVQEFPHEARYEDIKKRLEKGVHLRVNNYMQINW